MARLISDEDFPLVAVQDLRRRGHDVVTADDAGRARAGIPDDQVLAFATAAGRAVLTNNCWDFIRLHKADPRHAGIVACTFDDNYPALAARIDAAIGAIPTLAGRLIRIHRPSR